MINSVIESLKEISYIHLENQIGLQLLQKENSVWKNKAHIKLLSDILIKAMVKNSHPKVKEEIAKILEAAFKIDV